MSTKFFISFAAFCVITIGDLFYITLLYTNRQYFFIKKFNLIFPYHFILLFVRSQAAHKSPIGEG
ncbi:hypothetical protein D0U04_30430 [Bacillus clarus]|uniref:Uncharacterized protein n=1 Tax=Bacillus clarus TaxID=2338372 RepID=A0ABX9KLM7_9BACI|nr:hypothetical protein D0U04_30430 [Bacillus clarus]